MEINALNGGYRFFGKQNGQDSPEDLAPEDLNVAAETESLDVLAIRGTAVNVLDNIMRHIRSWGDQYYRYGLTHGRTAAKNHEIYHVAETQATLVTDRVISTVGGQIAALEAAICKNQNELDILKEHAQWAREANRELSDLRMNDSRQFSLFNAWFALIAGLIIILSDIIVSLNLVPFFGIGSLNFDAKFMDKVADPEILCFSIGLAFCTVYVKMLYDEYLGGKFGYHQHHFRHLEAKKADRWWIRMEFWIKFAAKMLIFVGLVLMLYYMAGFRTYFTIQNLASEADMADQLKGASKADDLPGLLRNSFMGITIILPIISGSAISVFLKVISNRRIRREAVAHQEKSDAELHRSGESLLELTFALEQLKQYQKEWSQRENKISLMARFFTHQYNQGFKMGYTRAHGTDFYKLIELARNEALNTTFTQKDETLHDSPAA
jgi:hypothetical protein